MARGPLIRRCANDRRRIVNWDRADGFLDDTYALEIEHTPRDMEKDKLLKAKIKQGLGRMGEAAERAAFDRAR